MDQLKKIALAVEYNGEGFCGWQRQPHCHAIQAELEQALTRIAQIPITVHCAGRTDTGVHALAQVVHFETTVMRPLRAWSFGVNSHLHRHVAVHWAAEMPAHFHARFSAVARSYRYTLLNRSTRPGLHARTMAWEKQPLDAQRMHLAAQQLVGEHDFSSFRSAQCQAAHARREIRRLQVVRQEDRIVIDITANGFLHNMVRIITGCLVAIGRGEQSIDWLTWLLGCRDRKRAATTVPAHGLCFLQPSYPDEFGVPDFGRLGEHPWHP